MPCKRAASPAPPIVPGKPDESLLIQAIRQTHERHQNAAERQAQGPGDCRHHGVGESGRGMARRLRLRSEAGQLRVCDHAGAARILVVPAGRKPAVPQ